MKDRRYTATELKVREVLLHLVSEEIMEEVLEIIHNRQQEVTELLESKKQDGLGILQ